MEIYIYLFPDLQNAAENDPPTLRTGDYEILRIPQIPQILTVGENPSSRETVRVRNRNARPSMITLEDRETVRVRKRNARPSQDMINR